MYCTKCDHCIESCTCPDLADRMRKLSGPKGGICARWCAGCDEHYAVCRCDEPKWVMRTDGRFGRLPADAVPEAVHETSAEA